MQTASRRLEKLLGGDPPVTREFLWLWARHVPPLLKGPFHPLVCSFPSHVIEKQAGSRAGNRFIRCSCRGSNRSWSRANLLYRSGDEQVIVRCCRLKLFAWFRRFGIFPAKTGYHKVQHKTAPLPPAAHRGAALNEGYCLSPQKIMSARAGWVGQVVWR